MENLAVLEFPPPPGSGLSVENTRSLLSFILVLTPLGAILIPLIIILFVFSPPHSRRHPVFILNILVCCLGIAEAVIGVVLDSNQILHPYQPVSKCLLIIVATLAVASPLLIDSILIFRILAFYPFDMTPTRTLVTILAFPLLVKCGRFAAIVMFLNSFTGRSTEGSQDLLRAILSNWPKNPYLTAEWTMQMVDNAYASSIFLYKIWEFRKIRNSAAAFRNQSLLLCLHSLFIIALGNFIFPVIMNIALIVLITRDPSFINGALVLISNNYVSILGVVFATIWTRKRNWNQPEEPFKGEPFQRRRVHSESRFAFDSTLNTRSLFSIPVFGPGPGTGVQATATAPA